MRSSVGVGRRAELAAMDALLGNLRHGRGGLVLITGEAGIGKSRLLAETSSRARSNGITTLVGRAVEGGGTYRAVAEALAGGVRDGRLAEHDDLRPCLPHWLGSSLAGRIRITR